MSKIPQEQVPGVYHRRIGEIVVTALSDGYLDGGVDVLRNIEPAEAERIHRRFPPRKAHRGELLRDPCRRQVGTDRDRIRHLPATHRRQTAAEPGRRRHRSADVEAVLLTHMHPDHSAGLSDPTTGARHFPNAELIVHANEPKHWHDDAAMEGRASAPAGSISNARASRSPRIPTACGLSRRGQEVFPGVTTVPLHGQTPATPAT